MFRILRIVNIKTPKIKGRKFLKIILGEGKNNFIIEYNEPENRLAEIEEINQPQ